LDVPWNISYFSLLNEKKTLGFSDKPCPSLIRATYRENFSGMFSAMC
jgi:hypothetical protein